MRRLVILYEDSLGAVQRFPLHDLVVKSAADLVPLEPHELFRRVIKVPKKGVNNVLGDVARSDRFLGRDARLLLWVDNDRIRRALQLPPGCAREAVIDTIKALAPEAHGTARPKPLELRVEIRRVRGGNGAMAGTALIGRNDSRCRRPCPIASVVR